MTDTIVMTGATSGFGAAALAAVAERHDGPIVLGARDAAFALDGAAHRIRVAPLDLESLASVRQFCDAVGAGPIRTLALNAGITSNRLGKTQYGVDRTFQVNFLSHFLMFNLLRNRLADDAVVVTTGSGTHDPNESAPPPPPKHAHANWLAYPENDPGRDRLTPRAAARAYTASKLCCILFAKELSRRYPNLRSLCFDPGFLPDTNLSREFPRLLAALVKRIVPYTMPRDRMGSIATTAPIYAQLVLGERTSGRRGEYLAMRGGQALAVEPSNLALDSALGEKLWEDCLQLIAAIGEPADSQ